VELAEFETRLASVVARRIERCLGVRSIERLSGGASQETYRLIVETEAGDEPMALRRAAGGKVEADAPPPTLATEALLMQCAAAAGVPEPDVYYVLQAEDRLGEGFLMQWLDGETLGARIVRAPELDEIRPRLARECGRILARIHAIDLDTTGLRERLEVIDPLELMNRSWERYKLFPTPQPMIDYAARWLAENIPPRFEERLVHNDFRNGNFMVGDSGIDAVLDWELAHIGDPMRDLGWICTNSWRFGRSELPVGGFGELADLLRGYEEVSGRAVDPEHVRFWQVFGSFWWAMTTLQMASTWRTGVTPSLERPVIGRRSSEAQIDCVNLLIPGAFSLPEPGKPISQGTQLPMPTELLSSVAAFLKEEVAGKLDSRDGFLARVAANSLGIAQREFQCGN
jgi:aminoglycoside phosphotransferase (APT) family kinase protein